jgi:hypothetical protein
MEDSLGTMGTPRRITDDRWKSDGRLVIGLDFRVVIGGVEWEWWCLRSCLMAKWDDLVMGIETVVGEKSWLNGKKMNKEKFSRLTSWDLQKFIQANRLFQYLS